MKKISLIEDHHQALDIWRRFKFKNLPLVHLDSHIDFGFYQAKPIHQTFEEAKNLKDLKRQLERTLLYQRYKDDLEAQLNIGNYIYPAMRDKIVNRFFWVIPGKREKFESDNNNLKRLIKSIKSNDPYQDTKIKVTDNKISTRLYGRDFQITDIFSIQKIKESILLDIDVDFLPFDSIRNTSLTKDIGRRKPWLYPKRLTGLIKDKFPQVVYTTISYSVNGGFTPIEYKFFGDEICLRLAKGSLSPVLERVFSLRNKAIDEYFKNELKSFQANFKEVLIILERCAGLDETFKVRFLAHLYFWLFKINWEIRKKNAARKYYQKVIQKDPTYRIRDNNSGWLYLKEGNLKSAFIEFEKMLYCDPKDTYALCGLGEIYFRYKRYYKARENYNKALQLNPKDKLALLGLASVYIQLNKLKQAADILFRLKDLEPFNSQRFILEAELTQKKGDFKKALFLYKEAVILGAGNIEIYEDVFKILKKEKDKELFNFFNQRYKDFKANFYKKQSKTLWRQKKNKEFRRLRDVLKRIDR